MKLLFMKQSAPVIWLCGISGSGKTSLAELIRRDLEEFGKACELLDGDRVRSFFEGSLGYSKEARIQNIRQITFAAHLLSENGVACVVANIAPFYEARDFIRRKLKNYIQIYLDISPEVAQKRDPKGVYANNSAEHIVGLGIPFEAPRKPDLHIKTDQMELAESYERIKGFLIDRNVLNK